MNNWKKDILNIPNMLSLFRLGLIPVYMYIYLTAKESWQYWLAGAVLAVSCMTDMVDGKIARKYNMITPLGKLLDPIADKLLVNSTIIILASRIPQLVIVAVVMIARDIVVDAVRLIAVTKNKVVAANIWGKLKTVFQMVAISLVLLNDFPFSFIPWNVNVSYILCYIAGVCSLLSMVVYIIQNREVFKDE